MKTFVKPELQVLEIRLEERIAACVEERYERNPTGPNANFDYPRPNLNCWIVIPAVEGNVS